MSWNNNGSDRHLVATLLLATVFVPLVSEAFPVDTTAFNGATALKPGLVTAGDGGETRTRGGAKEIFPIQSIEKRSAISNSSPRAGPL